MMLAVPCDGLLKTMVITRVKARRLLGMGVDAAGGRRLLWLLVSTEVSPFTIVETQVLICGVGGSGGGDYYVGIVYQLPYRQTA